MTNAEPQSIHGRGFLAGVVAGGILGTALTCYFAPRLTAELRLHITDSVRRFRRSATEHLDQVRPRVGDTVDQADHSAPTPTVADDSGDGVRRT